MSLPLNKVPNKSADRVNDTFFTNYFVLGEEHCIRL